MPLGAELEIKAERFIECQCERKFELEITVKQKIKSFRQSLCKLPIPFKHKVAVQHLFPKCTRQHCGGQSLSGAIEVRTA